MDTLTHALAGALIGEAAARWQPESNSGLSLQTRRKIFLPLAIIGSNLPDMDFVYSLVTASKLDYLLHHRGHTHTIVGVLLGAALLLVACEIWMRWRRMKPANADRIWLSALALVTPVIHVSMDATNTYGVHPYWPFNRYWLYGDAVFIIEPLFWAAAVPLLFVLQTRIARGMTAALLLLAGAWIVSTGLIPLASGVSLVAVTLAMLAVGYFASKRAAVVAGLGVWATATFVFILTHQVAQARVESFAAERYPHATIVNHALSPMPANPVCWEVVLTQLEGERYAIRRAMLTLAPEWVPAAVCPNRRLNDPTTAPLAQVADSGAAHWKWFGELSMRFDVLAQLSATRCEAAAFMRFARAPWAAPVENRWILGDLRYDRERELGFSEIEITPDVRCPIHVPPWVTPVAPFLEQRLRSQQLTSGTTAPDPKMQTAAP